MSDERTSTTSGRRRPGGRGAVLFAALVLSAVAASAAASAALSQEAPDPLEQQMEAEIEAMVDAGIPPDHPKVEMLEEELAELEEAGDAGAPAEPGVDVEAMIEEAEEAEAREEAGVAPAEPVWDSGEVLCEVVPGILGPDEIAGARCASVPQPDGTTRYVAVAPDGTVRTVAFGHDGDVRRLADVAVDAAVGPDTALAATPEGHLAVAPPGQAPATVDLP